MAAAAVLALTLSACGGGGHDVTDAATNTATLRYADILPKGHSTAKGLIKPFFDAVQANSRKQGCPITIDWFPSGQLGSSADQIDNLNRGVFDMAHVSSPYSPSQMPLGNAFNLPRMAPNAEILGKAYYDVIQNHDSAIYKADFEANTMVPVAAYALPLYQFVTVKPITDVDALRGLAIRSGGGAQDITVKALGGTPVQLSTNEQYEGLERGIIDGGLFNLPAVVTNKVSEVTHYFTTNADVASFNAALVVQQGVWDGLSPCRQGVLRDAGKAASFAYLASLQKLVTKSIAALKKNGLTAVEFDAPELAKLSDLLSGVADDWLHSIPAKLPAAAALNEARAAIKAES